MLTYFSDVVDSRFRIQYVKLVFENSSAKVTVQGIFDFLLKFVALSNSQFSDLQKTRTHNKGINPLRFFKRAQRAYLNEFIIYAYVICKFPIWNFKVNELRN